MAWTYTASPDTTTTQGKRDAVRLAIGDTDTNDQLLQDAEVDFFLSQANDNINGASSLAAKAIAGKYSRLADTSFDSVRVAYSQRYKSYLELATRLDREARRSGSLGAPAFGGTSISTMDAVDALPDRPESSFKRNQFNNTENRHEVDRDD